MRYLGLIAVVFLTVSAAAAAPGAPEAKSRVEIAEQAYTLTAAMYQNGMTQIEDVYRWSVRWLDSAGPATVKAHLQRMQTLEQKAQSRFAAGTAPKTDALAAAYFRAEAEAWVAGKRNP